jgi:hypothetical protein
MAFRNSMSVVWVTFAIAASTAGCATIDGRPMVFSEVPPSHGDGNFRDISWRYPWPEFHVGLPVPGFLIKFPGFDLSREYDAEFVVDDLHDIGSKVGVYLCVNDPDDRCRNDNTRKLLQASFEFEVRDSKGRLLTHAQKLLGEYSWCDPSRVGGRGCGLYSLEESFFSARAGEHYTIHVHYQPDPVLRDLWGCVYLECGGSV